MIHYFLIASAVLGVAVVVLSRRAIAPRPICPNCRALLEDFSVERCPHCLLWQPPNREHPRHGWNIARMLLGFALIFAPTFTWLLIPALHHNTKKKASSGQGSTALSPTVPLPSGLSRLPGRIQSLGYLSKRNSPARAGSQPTTLPSMTDEEAAFYQQMGFQVTTSAPGPEPIDDTAEDSASDSAAPPS